MTPDIYSFVQGKEVLLMTYNKKGTGLFTSQEIPLKGLGKPSQVQFPKTNQNQVLGNAHCKHCTLQTLHTAQSFLAGAGRPNFTGQGDIRQVDIV